MPQTNFLYRLNWKGRHYRLQIGGENAIIPENEMNEFLSQNNAPISAMLQLRNIPGNQPATFNINGQVAHITRIR